MASFILEEWSRPRMNTEWLRSSPKSTSKIHKLFKAKYKSCENSTIPISSGFTKYLRTKKICIWSKSNLFFYFQLLWRWRAVWEVVRARKFQRRRRQDNLPSNDWHDQVFKFAEDLSPWPQAIKFPYELKEIPRNEDHRLRPFVPMVKEHEPINDSAKEK